MNSLPGAAHRQRELRNWLFFRGLWVLLTTVLLFTACSRKPSQLYSSQLSANVFSYDRTFHSAALARDETYRVIIRKPFLPRQRIHVVYLLHGNGANYRDWSQSASLAPYADRNFVFIMPEGHSAYYVNSATKATERYEDFITQDLIDDAERGLPSNRDRAIAGVSMGGFGALVLALRHPGLYTVAGALSPALDVPERHFSLHRPLQSLEMEHIFGPYGSPSRLALDPFRIIARAPQPAPYIFLGYGTETLAAPILRFDRALTAAGLPHIAQQQPGGHDWQQWNRQLPNLFRTIASPPPSPEP